MFETIVKTNIIVFYYWNEFKYKILCTHIELNTARVYMILNGIIWHSFRNTKSILDQKIAN
jgi:hypothetical protein